MNLVSKSLFAVGLVVGVSALAAAQPAPSSPAAPAGQEPAAQSAAAPPPAGPFDGVKFGVAFEGFYQYNWNEPYDRINLLRAYDTRANVFGIQQAAIVVDGAPDVAAGRRFGARVDLQFGQATETVQGGAANEPRPDVYRHVWQAYGTYVFPVGRGLQADFGKFASNLGYETNYAKDNNNFSRAYLFNFLPFYHSGLRLSLPVSDAVTVMYMLTNGIQQTEDFNDYKSNHFTAIIKPTGSITWTTNYYFGQEQPDGGEPDGPDGFFRVFDTYVAYTPTSALSFGLDVNYVTNEVNKVDDALSLQGLGVYGRYQLSTPRRWRCATSASTTRGCSAASIRCCRRSPRPSNTSSPTASWFAASTAATGRTSRSSPAPRPDDLRDDQNTALIGLVWWFGNKTGAW